MGNDLKDADANDVIQSLAFALRYDGRKRTHTGDEFMARITAERLVEYLQKAGYVVKKQPSGWLHSTSDFMKQDEE